MNTKYIGINQYRYRYFKSPLGFIKLLLDVFTDPGYTNMEEYDLALGSTNEQIESFVKQEIQRIECMK